MKFIVYYKADKTVGELHERDVIFDDEFHWRTFETWCTKVRGAVPAKGVYKRQVFSILLLQAVEEDSADIVDILKRLTTFKEEKSLKGRSLANLVPNPLRANHTRVRFPTLNQVVTDSEMSMAESDVELPLHSAIPKSTSMRPPATKKVKVCAQRSMAGTSSAPQAIPVPFSSNSPANPPSTPTSIATSSAAVACTSANPSSLLQVIVTTMAQLKVAQQDLEHKVTMVYQQNQEILELLRSKQVSAAVEAPSVIHFSTLLNTDDLKRAQEQYAEDSNYRNNLITWLASAGKSSATLDDKVRKCNNKLLSLELQREITIHGYPGSEKRRATIALQPLDNGIFEAVRCSFPDAKDSDLSKLLSRHLVLAKQRGCVKSKRGADDKDDISVTEYEEIRQRNVEENQKFIDTILS